MMRLLVILLSIVALSGCDLSGSNVSTRTQIDRIPVSPEGRWHDLEAITMGGGRKTVAVTFSRRYLLQEYLGEGVPVRPVDPRRYREHLLVLDGRLADREAELAAFSTETRRRLRWMLERGSTVTSAPEQFGPIMRDRDAYPVGPNRSTVKVTWWPGGVLNGEPIEMEVAFVQEFEEWRIDGITPDPFSKEPDPVFGIPLAR